MNDTYYKNAVITTAAAYLGWQYFLCVRHGFKHGFTHLHGFTPLIFIRQLYEVAAIIIPIFINEETKPQGGYTICPGTLC